MQSIAAQLQQARERLAPVSGATAALEARMLAARAWSMDAETLVRDADAARDAAPLQQLVERRLTHEPMSHILGEKEFWRDTFLVTRDVLTPRADSETLIEALLVARPDKAAPLRMLDLGTGSGCLLLSALREYPNATGVGVDQSEAALAVAMGNAERLQLTARSAFVRGDWCSTLAGRFDVVLSNPPYIPQRDIAALDADVRLFEPHGALVGGADGLACYRSIFAQIIPHLAPSALLIFEVGAGQADEVAALGIAQGLTLSTISPDLAGIPRAVVFNTTQPEDKD